MQFYERTRILLLCLLLSVACGAPNAIGEDLLMALLDAGGAACGLGSRDTLRLEMGYPLGGQDLDETTSPLEADLGWVVGWDHEFVGKAALQRQRDEGLAKQLVAFTTEGRRFARHGYQARAGDSVGSVASGNFSPTLGHGIGMAYLSPPPSADSTIEVEIRGEWHSAEKITVGVLLSCILALADHTAGESTRRLK